MVQGPSDAVVHASFSQIELSISCALNSGQANCVGQIEEPSMTITSSFRESAKPFLVEGGGGSSPSPTPAPSQSGSSNTGKNGGSGVTDAVMGVWVLAGTVFAGMANLFFV